MPPGLHQGVVQCRSRREARGLGESVGATAQDPARASSFRHGRSPATSSMSPSRPDPPSRGPSAIFGRDGSCGCQRRSAYCSCACGPVSEVLSVMFIRARGLCTTNCRAGWVRPGPVWSLVSARSPIHEETRCRFRLTHIRNSRRWQPILSAVGGWRIGSGSAERLIILEAAPPWLRGGFLTHHTVTRTTLW